MPEYTITKRYERKITNDDFQSFSFSTELSKTVLVDSAETLVAEGEKLHNQAKYLTDQDILACSDEILNARKVHVVSKS